MYHLLAAGYARHTTSTLRIFPKAVRGLWKISSGVWLGLLLVPFARGCRLATCRATLARECCLLSGILHSLRPVHDLRTVSHLDDRFRGDQIEIVHLVTVWAQDHQVADSVVCAVAVDVGDF